MYFEKLYLELTRECTMQCEHCLRGDREHKYMSIETLENLLKEVNNIETLLLSGGEPLLHIDALEALSKLIDKASGTNNSIVSMAFSFCFLGTLKSSVLIL